MDFTSLVHYAKHNSEYDNDITRHVETVTYGDPLEEVLNRKTKHSKLQDPARETNSVEEQKVCDNPEENTRSTKYHDIKLSKDKEETSTQSLLDEYKYCKDVISFITSKYSLENSENKDSVTKPAYRNVNDVLVFTVTKDRTNFPKMNETKFDDAPKPCDAPKDFDAPKPCDAPKPGNTPKSCDASKPCDALEPCNGPKTCKSCSKRICQSESDIPSSPSSCSCSEKTSKSKMTCCPKKSDSSCNVPADDCSRKCSKESCVSPESQLGDCVMRFVKCLEDKKAADVSTKSSESDADAKPCLFQNVQIAPPEVPPCPNKSSPKSSFQNFVVSSATTLATFKTSVQDFIGTVCDKTREATKFVTDEGLKALGFKENPKCSNKDSDLESDCTKPKKCDFSRENEPNIERREVKTAIHIYEDVSCKSLTSVPGVFEGIVALKYDKSSKYDIPKMDETDIRYRSLLGSIKDKVVSYIMNPLGDNNCENDDGGSGKSGTDKACHSDDIISPHHIGVINNNQADEGKDSDGKTCEEKKNPATENFDDKN